MLRHAISFLVLFCNIMIVYGTINAKHYIVYMGEHSHSNKDAVISANLDMLASITGSDLEAKEATTHHYGRSFRGFAAMLTPEQAQLLEDDEEVISVFESKMYELQTTHSWDFLGVPLHGSLGAAVHLGSDVIVGFIDSGIWPESESFNDEGLGPVPKRFKGECVPGQNFTKANCNRKIIGARYFHKGYESLYGPLESVGDPFFRSVRDAEGHGTHTASTVAGIASPSTSMLGLASGTARGGAPGARIASYKAWDTVSRSRGSDNNADMLSAFDEAVADGVDVISISVAFETAMSFFQDPIAIGSFHAFRKGILVSAAAGNSGGHGTVANVAPWMLTIGASSIDRKFNGFVHLGNKQVLRGSTLNTESLEGKHEIINGKAAVAHGIPAANASYCQNNSLNHELVAGKIVVCMPEGEADSRADKAIMVKSAGGVGMILIDPVYIDMARDYVVPTVVIGSDDSELLYKYLATEKNPVATISKAQTIIGRLRAPVVAVFSSRGPNIITPDIIKPDVTAPGLNILAAWSPVAVTRTAGRSLDHFIVSGTSMACPHASAAAAIVKASHPGWSPSTIMSALMTTALVEDNDRKPVLSHPNSTHLIAATPFDFGSGHLNPVAAVNPGLVYGFTAGDILQFLCSNGANSTILKYLTNNNVKCRSHPAASFNLNYPSIGVGNMKGATTVRRTVKSVQGGKRVYDVKVESPKGVVVRVVPERLEFSKYGEKKDFTIKLVPKETSRGGFVFGSITWCDGVHKVRSPIAVNVVSL